MRIIRLKIKPHVKDKLLELSKLFRIVDAGLTEDIFSLLRYKGNGLPDEDRQKSITTYLVGKTSINQVSASIMVKKRAQFLRKITNLNYFKALCMSNDPLSSVERILTSFRYLAGVHREVQCKKCNLFNKCKFGQQYSSMTGDISKVMNPKYEDLVHEDCPSMPEFTAFDGLHKAIDRLRSMQDAEKAEHNMADANGLYGAKEIGNMDEEFGDKEDSYLGQEDVDLDCLNMEDEDFPFFDSAGSGGSSIFNASFTGNHYAKAVESMISCLTSAKLDIYDLAKNLEMELNSKKKGKMKPVDEMEHDSKKENIRSEAEISKVLPSQHGLPEEVFDKKAHDKSLEKKRHLKPDEKKQLLYLLIDNSISMKAQLRDNKTSALTRGALASVFSIALIRRVVADKGIVYVRFFAGTPSSLRVADTKERQENLLKSISNADYNGSGTNLGAALKAACEDIRKGKSHVNIAKSEILLITDCDDSLNPTTLDAARGTGDNKIPLHVLDVSGVSRQCGSASAVLKTVADKYFKINKGETDVSKMVDLL